MRSLRAVRVGLLLILSLLALSAVSVAYAGDDDDELVDVRKTVARLEKKMSERREHGRWARDGKLSLSAFCGEDAVSPVFAAWGDSAIYVFAPGGDFESPSGW